jgi:hypothetical protein
MCFSIPRTGIIGLSPWGRTPTEIHHYYGPNGEQLPGPPKALNKENVYPTDFILKATLEYGRFFPLDVNQNMLMKIKYKIIYYNVHRNNRWFMVFNATFNNISVISWRKNKRAKNERLNYVLIICLKHGRIDLWYDYYLLSTLVMLNINTYAFYVCR